MHVLYALNTHVKFCVNWILFTIWSIRLYFNLCIILNYKNLQFKQFIDNIAIDFLFSRNFANIKDIRRKCNPMVDLSKFISNKKIFSNGLVLDLLQLILQLNFVLFIFIFIFYILYLFNMRFFLKLFIVFVF